MNIVKQINIKKLILKGLSFVFHSTYGAGVNGGDMLQSTSLGRKVKVVRLRSQLSTEDTGATEF